MRLELLGFTLEAAGIAFMVGVARERYRARQDVETYRAALQNGPPTVLKSLPDAAREAEQHSTRMLGIHQKRLEALAQLTLEVWLQGLREIRRLDLIIQRLRAPEDCDIIIEYILELGGIRWGFPGFDKRFLLRLLLEACAPDEPVDYDLTDLVVGEVFDSSADMVAYAEYLINREHEIYRRIIVLTEGVSDKWILERSLKLLYPLDLHRIAHRGKRPSIGEEAQARLSDTNPPVPALVGFQSS
jgi:hypothetical protein